MPRTFALAPTVADVARIAAHPDAVLRNLRITQAYHELALATRAGIGAGANWCAFATWASRQAGRTIRREDLREALRQRLEVSPEVRRLAEHALAAVGGVALIPTLGRLLDEVTRALDVEGTLDRAAAAVAAGNLKVFEEIAARFARFLEIRAGPAPDALARFLDDLTPGEPPRGQRMLREAFEAYVAATSADSDHRRAQLLHYGNLLIGMHEQTRLQPEIAAALNAPFDGVAVRDQVVRALLPGFWRGIRYRLAALFGRRPPLDEIVDALVAEAQRELRHLLTAYAMTLHLPEGVTVQLGRAIGGRHADSLATITEPRLLRLLEQVDPDPLSLAGGGAFDWSVLGERMHLIADLFRRFHDWAPLFDPPYTGDQLTALRGGRLPDPPL